MKKRFIIITILVVIGIVLLIINNQLYCQPAPTTSVSPMPIDSVAMLDRSVRTVDIYMETIAKMYEAQDYLAHAQFTARLVQILNRLPAKIHMGCAEKIGRAIQSKGMAAYTTIIIEYTYRLSRYPTKARLETLRRLRKEIASSFETIDKRQQGAVLIRTDQRGSLRVYSANVGRAVAAFALTEEGYEMVASGAEPEDLVRVLAMAEICRQQTADGEMISVYGFESCTKLGDIVAGALAEMGMAPATAGGMIAGLAPGISRGAEICLEEEANTISAEFIAAMEKFISCMENQIASVRQGANITPWGTLMQNSGKENEFSHNLNDALSGFTHTGTTVDETETGAQYTHSFENSATGETATVTEYTQTYGESWASSTTETGTLVSFTGPDGTKTTMYDGNGTPIEYLFEGAGDYEGITVYETYHSNGNVETRLTTNDNTGENKKEEFDDEGNKISEETETASTPLGEWDNYPCGTDLGKKIMESELEAIGSPLDPYIIPDPDAPISGFGSDCLGAAISEPAATCSPSVAMCLDPVYSTDGCDCGATTEVPDIPVLSSNCLYANCGPDGECNPVTGTCQSSGGVGDIPEIWPPFDDPEHPPINIPPPTEPPMGLPD